jgi:hypothetical protein
MSVSLASPPGLPMPEIVADLPLAPLLSAVIRCYPLLPPLLPPLLSVVSPAVILLFF